MARHSDLINRRDKAIFSKFVSIRKLGRNSSQAFDLLSETFYLSPRRIKTIVYHSKFHSERLALAKEKEKPIFDIKFMKQ